MSAELTLNEVLEIVSDYRAGLPIAEIARKWKLHPSTINRLRTRLGEPARLARTASAETIQAAREILNQEGV